MMLSLSIITILISHMSCDPVSFFSPMSRTVTSSLHGIKNRPKLSILATVNYKGDYYAVGPYSSKAMELALDRLHLEPEFLDGRYQLSFDLVDDECSNAKFIRGVMAELLKSSNRLPLFILNDCATGGQYILGDVIKNFDILGFTYYPIGGYNPQGDANLIQLLIPSHISYFEGVVKMSVQYQWREVAFFSENFHYFNEIDSLLFSLFDLHNISVNWMDKVKAYLVDQDEVNSAFIDMKKRDPRIIFANINDPVTFSCWLYKHDLYGPDKVILGTNWLVYDPDYATIPDSLSSWCTREMLVKVHPSWMYYGISRMSDVYGKTYVDSTGMSSVMFKEAMSKKILNPDFENVFLWKFYDIALFVGKTVDEAIKTGRRNNRSISDLMTDSKLFQQTVYSLRVKGTRSVFDIDPVFKANTEGYSANVLIQNRFIDGVWKKSVFGYYHTTHKEYIELNGGPAWFTKDGLPPKFKVQRIRVKQPANSLISFVVLAVLASILIAICIGSIVITFVRHQDTETCYSIFILVGDVILLSHVYFIPLESWESNSTNLFVSIFLLLSGVSLTNLGLLMKLWNSKRSAKTMRWQTLNATFRNWKSILALAVWMFLNIAFVLALKESSILVIKERKWDSYTSADGNTVFEPYQLEYSMATFPLALTVVTIVVVLLNVLFLLGQVFVAYLLKRKLTQRKVIISPVDLNALERMKADGIAAYCQCIIVFAASVTVLTATGNAERMTTLIGVFTLIYAGLYAVIAHMMQIFRPLLSLAEQQAIKGKLQPQYITRSRRQSRYSSTFQTK